MGGPPNVAALITDQIEVSVVLVTLERAQRQSQEARRGDVRRHERPERDAPADGTIRGAHGFLADKVKSLARLQGIEADVGAVGPANLNTAKGILAKVGLKDGDYNHRSARHGPAHQRDESRHLRRRLYKLEPNASVMNQLGFAKTVEAGVIARYVLGDPQSDPFAAGCAFSSDFITKRPDVAKRFAAAWAKALD